MTKRITTRLAGAAMLMSFAGFAAAAGQDGPANTGGAPQATQVPQARAGVKGPVKNNDAYFAALMKCDSLTGVGEKQQCVESVRKQYGQM